MPLARSRSAAPLAPSPSFWRPASASDARPPASPWARNLGQPRPPVPRPFLPVLMTDSLCQFPPAPAPVPAKPALAAPKTRPQCPNPAYTPSRPLLQTAPLLLPFSRSSSSSSSSCRLASFSPFSSHPPPSAKHPRVPRPSWTCAPPSWATCIQLRDTQPCRNPADSVNRDPSRRSSASASASILYTACATSRLFVSPRALS